MDRSPARGPGTADRTPLAVAVVEALAEREAVDAVELDRPLYDVVDPDALEALFPADGEGRPASHGHVTFRYGNYEVCVSSDRSVRILGPGAAGNGGPDAGDS